MKGKGLPRWGLLGLAVAGIAVAIAGCGGGDALCCGGGGGGGGVNLPPGFNFRGIALVPRPEGAGASEGTDITIVRGLNTSTPASDTAPLATTLDSIDVIQLSDDAKVGLVDGENSMAIIRGMDTNSPTVGAKVAAPDGGAASGIMVRNDDLTALLAGSDGVHIVTGLNAATPTLGPVLAGGFRTRNDFLVYNEAKTFAVIGSAGHGFSGGSNKSMQIVLNASSATPTVGPTITLPEGNFGYEGKGGISISAADPTRMVVPVDGGILLVTGLNTATPTVGSVVPIPGLPTGDSPVSTAITRDGTRVIVATTQGAIVFSGVNTGTLTAATSFLSIDSTGTQENGNMGVQFGLDNRAAFINNNHTQKLYMITGFTGSTLTVAQSVTLLPSETGRQDDDALILH